MSQGFGRNSMEKSLQENIRNTINVTIEDNKILIPECAHMKH